MGGGSRREETTTGESHQEEVEEGRKNTPGVGGGIRGTEHTASVHAQNDAIKTNHMQNKKY